MYRQNNQSYRRFKRGRNNKTSQHLNTRNQFQNRRQAIIKLDENLFVTKAKEMPIKSSIESSVLFTHYALNLSLQNNIKDHGYTHPTAIQEQAIPHLLQNRDVIGIANTGTGKTAAFLIPLINKIYENREQRVLIVIPTRELAMQIVDEFYAFSRNMQLHATLCIGGANIQRQEISLQRQPQFVVGTPGRLKDLIKRKRLHLQYFQNIVLDEVDRMVDIGFLKDIQYLISLLPAQRQSLFFSATIPTKAKDVLQRFVSNPVTVSVKKQATPENVDQDIIKVKDKNEKLDKLHDLLIKKEFQKVMIFGRTKWEIEKLTRVLQERGFKAASIHGNKSQNQRQRALTQFKQNQLQVLLATDVASRGLDIDNVTHVINYNQPATYDDYIHRIGRTGRAGKKGTALTFVD